jgi:hypothetical protein
MRRHPFTEIRYGIFSLIMALQNSAEGVIFFRFLVGIGLGIELVTIDTRRRPSRSASGASRLAPINSPIKVEEAKAA